MSEPTPCQEAMRRHIESGTCPWCNRGPWVVLASHTNRAHGVGPDELRNMAGLLKSDSICDPQHRQNIQERIAADGVVPPVNQGNRKTPVYSVAGAQRKAKASRENLGRIDRKTLVENGRRAAAANNQVKDRRKCAICDGQIPYRHGNARQKTCSPGCLQELRSRRMKAWRTAATEKHSLT